MKNSYPVTFDAAINRDTFELDTISFGPGSGNANQKERKISEKEKEKEGRGKKCGNEIGERSIDVTLINPCLFVFSSSNTF